MITDVVKGRKIGWLHDDLDNRATVGRCITVAYRLLLPAGYGTENTHTTW